MTGYIQLIRLVMTLAMIIVVYWSLQCINLDKIIFKNRMEQARLLLLLAAILLGVGVSNAIFSLSDSLNSIVQFITSK